jgi:hypothetical protein
MPGSRPAHGPARALSSGARSGAATGRFCGCGRPIRSTRQTAAKERTFISAAGAPKVGISALLDLARWRQKCRTDLTGGDPCPTSRLTQFPPIPNFVEPSRAAQAIVDGPAADGAAEDPAVAERVNLATPSRADRRRGGEA